MPQDFQATLVIHALLDIIQMEEYAVLVKLLIKIAMFAVMAQFVQLVPLDILATHALHAPPATIHQHYHP